MKTFFVTPTCIDPKSWSMIGVSSKPNSDNPIGRFGTGLKYAIAISLRLGWDISITNYQEGVAEKHVFSQAKDSFRGQEINTIYDNNERMPYTTHYGSHWEPWTVLRELYSNTLDENGYLDFSEPSITNGSVIEINGEQMHSLAKNCEDYFLLGDNLVKNTFKDCGKVQILNKKYAGKIFLKGVFIGEMQDCAHGYNFEKDVRLTEDRTIYDKWSIGYDITAAVLTSEYDSIFEQWLLLSGYGEENFACISHNSWSSSFIAAVKQLRVKHPVKLLSNIAKNMPKESREYESFNLQESHQKMLSRALGSIEKAGFNIDREITCVKTDDEELIAFVEDKVIHLTLKCFKNMSYLISTLIEELAHCEGYVDETRNFETYLCDNMARLIENNY